MRLRTLILSVIFLNLGLGLFLPLYSSTANPQESSQPLLDLKLKKKDATTDKTGYSFEGIGKNIFWKDKKVDLAFQGNLKQDAGMSILEITSGNVSFNDTAPDEFSLYLINKDKLITVTYFQTKGFIIKGTIDLNNSAFLNLSIDIKGISLGEFNEFWGMTDFPFKGDFRGQIMLNGNLNNLFIKGTLEAYQGNLEEYKYDKVLLNFRGAYPWVQFYDSYAIIQNMNFDIEGALNLAKLYNLPYEKIAKSTSLDDEEFIEAIDEKKDITPECIKGFLELPEKRDSLIYKLGTDSFLKLVPRGDGFPIKPKLEF